MDTSNSKIFPFFSKGGAKIYRATRVWEGEGIKEIHAE